MNFKTNKCPDRQTDMVTLRDFELVTAPFNTRDLFNASMINFNLPGIQCVKRSLLDSHILAAAYAWQEGIVHREE